MKKFIMVMAMVLVMALTAIGVYFYTEEKMAADAREELYTARMEAADNALRKLVEADQYEEISALDLDDRVVYQVEEVDGSHWVGFSTKRSLYYMIIQDESVVDIQWAYPDYDNN